MNQTGTYRTFHATAAEYTFFSSTHQTFFKRDRMLGYKTVLTKFKKINDIPNIFSTHYIMKGEINNRRKTGIVTNTWTLNSTLLSNQWVKEEIIGSLVTQSHQSLHMGQQSYFHSFILKENHG